MTCHLCMSYRHPLRGASHPFWVKTSAAAIAIFWSRMAVGPWLWISRQLTVGLGHRCSQSSSFCAGEISCTSLVGGFGRPRSNLSNRFVISNSRCRSRGLNGDDVMRVRFGRLELGVRGQIDHDAEKLRRRCGLRTRIGQGVKRLHGVNTMPLIGVVVTHNFFKDIGSFRDVLLRALTFSLTTALASNLLELNRLNEGIILARTFPIGIAQNVTVFSADEFF